MPVERDLRKLFSGDDPGRRLREGAADWLKRAEANGLKREQEALRHVYDTTVELVVTISQVTHDPPLWRLECEVQPVGKITLTDRDKNQLIPELRHHVAKKLPVAAPGVLPDTARKLAANMQVRANYVLLRDSQRHESEWNR